MTALELLACAALIGVSAWLSSSEIALFSLSRYQLRSLKERFRTPHRKIKKLLADPTGLLITILVCNEIVNIGLSSIIAENISHTPKPRFLTETLALPTWIIDTVIGIFLTTPIVLLFCEVTPKIVGSRANRLIAPMTAGPLSALYGLFKPIRFVLSTLVARVAAWTAPSEAPVSAAELVAEAAKNGDAPAAEKEGESNEPERKLLREADFIMMLEEGHKEGAVQQSELELIKNVFDLDDTTVAEIFTPLPQVQTVNERTTLKSALNMMRSQKYSRIPVTSSAGPPTRRKVVGILYSKDLLRARLQPEMMSQTIDNLMRKPLFVNSTIKLNALFRKFKQQRTHMAVVQGQSGDTLGIVTMSDVLETLFEGILPDPDENEDESA